MRLIDADLLKKNIAKWLNGSDPQETVMVKLDDISVSVIMEIEEQPTAFDTEKFVEEVKKLDLDGVSMVEDGKYTLVRRNEVISLIQTNGVCNGRQKSCKYCYKKDCPLSTEKTLSDKWSDIVKKGGVE